MKAAYTLWGLPGRRKNSPDVSLTLTSLYADGDAVVSARPTRGAALAMDDMIRAAAAMHVP
jgi:hypothetical protein